MRTFYLFLINDLSILKIKKDTSVLNRVLVPCLFGLLFVASNLFAVLINFLLRQDIDYYQYVVVNSIITFITGSYLIAILREKIQEKINRVIYPCCKKIISLLKCWFYFLIGWYFFLFLRTFLISQFPTLEPLLNLIMVYWLYAQLFSLFIFSLAVFIPTSHYLSSGKNEIEERKTIANCVTFLTPILGFPWIYTAYFIWTFAEIPTNYSWLIYLVIFAVYVGVFLAFVDFPYYAGTLDKKRVDLEGINNNRNRLLDDFQKLGNNSQDVLKKLLLESEIARLDREKQFIESRRLHPYKLIIPSLSLALTIIIALIIEWLKTFLPHFGG